MLTGKNGCVILFGVKKHTAHWIELAEYDLVTAKHLLKTKRYVYVVFMCHLAIEKLLKACITEFTEMFPPKIHELDKLARLSNIEFPPEHATFVLELSAKGVPTRYPEDLKEYNHQIAQACLTNTREVAKWLEQKLKSAT